MKTAKPPESSQDLLAEYKLDYSKAKPNRFAANTKLTVTLDPGRANIYQF